jgi:flagellin
MSLRIQTNAAALNSHRQLSSADTGMSKNLEKLSSGFRINRAADDAAGLSMSSKFTAQIRSMNVASRNASQANSLLQIAEGGMDQVGNILSRLKELATQASSANSGANLTDINAEATALKSEMDRISNSTTFQGTKLIDGTFGATMTSGKTLTVAANLYDLDVSGASSHVFSVTYSSAAANTLTIKDMSTSVSQNITKAAGAATYNFTAFGISFKTTGAADQSTTLDALATGWSNQISVDASATPKTFQIGETNGSNFQISFSISSSKIDTLFSSGGGTNVQLDTAAHAQTAMDFIDYAIGQLATARANIGAVMNRLDYTSANLATSIENASAANSVIKDVDMASEMTAFTKNQILVQAGTAMLAQANQSSQTVLSLFK